MTENTHDVLRKLVARVACKPGWSFRLVDEGVGALRLVIRIDTVDAYAPGEPYTIDHYHPVPTTTYSEKTWRRWIFEQCRRTENHELGEFFRIGEDRPFAPLHAPGEDPYTVSEYRDEVDARTTQSGAVRNA